MEDFHVQWHITDKCNLRCLHCYGDSFSGERDLSWPELKKVCDNLTDSMKKQDRQLTLSLTGGEPFLKEELPDLLSYLSRSRYVKELSLISNGMYMDDFISKIKDIPKFSHIYVSLDGFSPEVNDSVRGIGVFDKVINNIREVKKEGFKVSVMFTLLKDNFKEVSKAVYFMAKNNLDSVIIERFVPLGQSKEISAEQLLTKEELLKVYKNIFLQCQTRFFPEAVQYHALKIVLKDGETDLLGAECIVARAGCAIMPDADVLPCRRFSLPVGNLLFDSLDDIWKDSQVLKTLRIRNNLKGKCKDCIIEECWGCRAIAYAMTNDYLQEDPLCWLDR